MFRSFFTFGGTGTKGRTKIRGEEKNIRSHRSVSLCNPKTQKFSRNTIGLLAGATIFAVFAGTYAFAEESSSSNTSTLNYEFPLKKMKEHSDKSKTPVVLLACGSFSPITNMHLRLLEMAKDFFEQNGCSVLGGYLSPVSDSYGKKGLVSAEDRVNMANLATDASDWIMVDAWESIKPNWTQTKLVIDHVDEEINQNRRQFEKIGVILICGSDLLDSFNVPGLWTEEDITSICKGGIGCITREGADPERVIWSNELLYKQRNNIHIIHQWIPNDISSTRIRLALSRNLSVKYLIPDPVLKYISDNGLYKQPS